MKTTFRSIRLLVLTIMGFLYSAPDVVAAEYHVVIGSFAHESNARKFTANVKNIFNEVSCSYSERTRLYYVSVLRTQNKEDAHNLILYLKREKGFKDAWVLINSDGEQNIATRPVVTYARGKARFEASKPSTQTFSPVLVASSRDREDNNDRFIAVPRENESTAKWTHTNGLSFITNVDDKQSALTGLPNANTNILRFVVEDERGNSIPSEVMLVNFETVRKIASFDAGDKIAIKGTRPNQMVTFVCERLGYSQETRMFNLDHLSRGRDISKDANGVWEIRIKLKPMELHDIAGMNNTTFYKDAVVLQTSSREELDELVILMQTHPHYKVVLHSHCNSSGKRTIKVPTDDTNYFDIEATVSEMASDKKLTKKRAELVRNYLTGHGIDKKRIHIVGWGSLEPIVSSASKDAALNERLEIELVE